MFGKKNNQHDQHDLPPELDPLLMNDYAQSMIEVLNGKELNIQMVKHVALLRRESYEELINQGFNEEQALELCKQPLTL